MDKIETVAQLFEYAIELEKAAETLYRQLGELFVDYPNVVSFWKHYADEEKGHALYLERVREAMEPETLSQAADKDIIQQARQCLSTISQVRLEDIYNLEDAYQLATELENSETNAIFEFVFMNFSADELAKSRQFLRAQLTTHIAKLRDEFPSEYQTSASRRKVSVRRNRGG